jgi:hypothetical protein
MRDRTDLRTRRGIIELHVWYFVDKSQWGDGPWQDEPDKVQWRDKSTGFPCLAVRHRRHGHWCGYVGVTREHPYFEKCAYDLDVEAHFGLNFSAMCQVDDDDKEHGVCHIPEPGQTDEVWWLGFDCAHAGDLCPGLESFVARMRQIVGIHFHSTDTYKTLDYVRAECEHIAEQLKQAQVNHNQQAPKKMNESQDTSHT